MIPQGRRCGFILWVIRKKCFLLSRNFLAFVENQSGKKLKSLRTDNGGEYISKEFQDFCVKKGTKRQLTFSSTPAHNGVAQRMNCTIQERSTSMLCMANLSLGFWKLYTQLCTLSTSMPLDFQISE